MIKIIKKGESEAEKLNKRAKFICPVCECVWIAEPSDFTIKKVKVRHFLCEDAYTTIEYRPVMRCPYERCENKFEVTGNIMEEDKNDT